MLNFKQLILTSLVFASTFAKQDSYLDKAKNYSQKTVDFVKVNAKKSKEFVKKNKEYIYVGAVATVIGLGAYGSYRMDAAKTKDYKWYSKMAISPFVGGYSILPDSKAFVVKKCKAAIDAIKGLKLQEKPYDFMNAVKDLSK